MFGFGWAEPRSQRAWRLLVGLQVLLLVFSLVAPIGAIAADPSDPPPSAEPSAPPSPEPTPEPTPEATPEPPAPEPSAEPAPDPTPDPTQAPTPSPEPASPFIVTFSAGVSAADQASTIEAAGATTTDTIAALRMHAVSASSGAAAALASDARVTRVEPDRSRATEADPSDPAYGFQWALPKIGWDQVNGSAVSGSAIVAILDTGVDGSHPDLAGQLVAGASFVGGSASSDPNGHGTAMAGIVAASVDNGTGIAGVGWDGVSIMPVSVLGADGTGRDSDVIEGLVWAADQDADVVLMAFSATGYSSALQSAADYAWSRGVVLVAATGNDGSSAAAFPAGDRGVIGVSNTDESDALNASSNFGASTFLAAPGTGVVTLAAGGGTTSVTGTSAAAAHVAATAALLRASDESLSNGAIVGRLARTADAAGTATETGNGRLNLARAFLDTSTDPVQPAGAAPVGDGRPFVGPYVAAAKTARFDPAIASTAEGNSGPTTLVFNVVTNGNGTGTVDFATAPSGTNPAIQGTGTCDGNEDYIGQSGVLTFTGSGGANEPKTISITICGDATFEPSETFTVTLSNPSPTGGNGMNVGNPSVATGTITNDDAANVAPSVTPPANQSTNEGSSTALALGSFTDTDGPGPWAVNVDWGDGSADTTFSVASAGSFGTQNHTYPDGPATHTVTVTVTDGNGSGASGSATFQVTVANVAPIVTFASGDATVNESQTDEHLYTFSIFDPGGDDVLGITTSCGIGGVMVPLSPTWDNTSLSFRCTFPDGPATPQLIAAASDDLATGAQAHFDVTVNNVAPVVAFTSGDTVVNESATDEHLYTFSIFDPGDTIDGITTSCGIGGVMVSGSPMWNDVSGSFRCTFPDGPATPQLIAAASDDTETGAQAHLDVTVNAVNSPPVITNIEAVPNSVGEGSGSLISASATDPDGDPLTFAFDCTNDGIIDFGPGPSMSATCVYDEGPAGHLVRVVVDDGEGGSDEATTAVDVFNLPPDGDFSASSPVDEGSPSTLSWDNVTDPSPVDSAAGFHYSFACSGDIGGLQGDYDLAQVSNTSTCAFADDGAYGVAGSVIDEDNGSETGGAVVTVVNVPPSLSDVAFNHAAVGEGDPATLSGAISDPGTLDTFTLVVDWGDGTTETFSYPAGTTAFSETHVWVDDNPTATPDDTYAVALTLTDDDGGATTAGTSIRIDNIQPTLGPTTLTPSVEEGSSAILAGSFTDPGIEDTFTLTVDWGDGTIEVIPLGTSHSFNLSHLYVDDGPSGPPPYFTYNVSWTVVDDDTGAAVGVGTVIVDNAAPLTILVGPAAVDEGTTHDYAFTTTDPGVADTFALVEATCGANGFNLTWVEAFDPADGSGVFTCDFRDDGVSTVQVTVEDDDTGLSIFPINVQVNNVNPQASIGGAQTADEGDVVAFDAIVTDQGPDDTFPGNVWLVSCVPSGQTEEASTHPVLHFEFTPTDDGTCTVEFRVSDDDGGEGVAVAEVTVNNVAPADLTATATPAAVDENGSVTVSGTFTDPGSGDTHAVVIDWGDGSADTVINHAAGVLAYSASHQYLDDNPTATASDVYPVGVSVSDDDGDSTSASTSVTVTNLAPTLSAPIFNFNPITGTATASIVIGDAGSLDTHTATFSWGNGDTSTGTIAGGVASATYTYPVGCPANAPSVVVTDDDTGSATHTYVASIDHYSATFQAPIQGNARNIVKQGNVIPVKLLLETCTGQPVLGRTLQVWYVEGIVYDDDTDAGSLQVTESVSNADSGQFMRQVDGKYMYNLSTKTLRTNLPYTVVIREPATNSFVASFVIQTKK